MRTFLHLPLLACLMLLAACGGGSSSTPSDPTDPMGPTDPDSGNPTDTSAQTPAAVKQAASNSFGSSINSSAQNLSSDGLVFLSGDDDENDANADTMTTGLEINSTLQRAYESSLALNDDAGERTTQNGSTVIVDPDESEMCDVLIAGDELAPDIDQETCRQLIADMTVQLVANSDTAGSVSYRFQDTPLITVGYGDAAESIEVSLAGLQRLAQARETLSPSGDDAGDQLGMASGSIRLSASTSSTTEGEEAGTIGIDITEALSLNNADNTGSIDLGTGTLLSMSADNAAGTARIEFDIGALQALGDNGEDSFRYDLDGLTATIEADADNGSFSVQNLSLGKGPLLIQIDGQERLRASMGSWGFVSSLLDETDEDSTPSLMLTGDISLNVLLNDSFEDELAFMSAMLEFTATDGTTLGNREDLDDPSSESVFSVLEGGPLSVSLTTTGDDEITRSETITVNAGQCAGQVDSPDPDSGDLELQLIDC